MIDLHAHSTASDGTDKPSELVAHAAAIGLTAVALTDHDTIEGLSEAAAAAVDVGIRFVPGIELSIEDSDKRRFHLLSYLFDSEDKPLNETLLRVREWRDNRNGLIIRRAQQAGIDLTLDDVRAEAGEGSHVLGRPHFAAALVKKGLSSSIQNAFDRYLASGRPLNEPKPSLSPVEAADLIHASGGVTIMAHPGLIKWADRRILELYVRELKEIGAIDGIECYHPRHSNEHTAWFLRLAEDAKLLVTGGSDYHGANKPDISLGVIHNGEALPSTLLDHLREAVRKHSAVIPAGA